MSNQIVQCVVLKARFCSVFCCLLMVKIRILILRHSGLKCTYSELSFVFVYSKFGLLRAKLESLRANLCSVFSYG